MACEAALKPLPSGDHKGLFCAGGVLVRANKILLVKRSDDRAFILVGAEVNVGRRRCRGERPEAERQRHQHTREPVPAHRSHLTPFVP